MGGQIQQSRADGGVGARRRQHWRRLAAPAARARVQREGDRAPHREAPAAPGLARRLRRRATGARATTGAGWPRCSRAARTPCSATRARRRSGGSCPRAGSVHVSVIAASTGASRDRRPSPASRSARATSRDMPRHPVTTAGLHADRPRRRPRRRDDSRRRSTRRTSATWSTRTSFASRSADARRQTGVRRAPQPPGPSAPSRSPTPSSSGASCRSRAKAGLSAAGDPGPVNGFRVDFYWPDLGLVVETDGLRYHRTPAQQARGPDARPDARRGRADGAPLHARPGPVRAEHVRSILRPSSAIAELTPL